MKIGTFLFLMIALNVCAWGQGRIAVDTGWHHIRNSEPREWSVFPDTAREKKYILTFKSNVNVIGNALSIRQYDVKLNWKISLNGEPMGSLVTDEKDLNAFYKIPAGMLREENILEIFCSDEQSDDIFLGEIVLHPRPLAAVLSESHMGITVIDEETGKSIPARITIVNAMGILQTVTGSTDNPLAVRPGYVYTGNGNAVLGLPAGRYTLYATRGFEYGVDSAEVHLQAGDFQTHRFSLKREVQTAGWAASDTHIHTRTWSGHGDATTAERVLTIAGEGIELPVMTDHNVQVDLAPFARDQDVARYFTSVTGNEVTTSTGHFNVFPLATGDKTAEHRGPDWKTLKENLPSAKNSAIILNHARDLHVNFRPFDSRLHLSIAGMRLDGQDSFFNAMEVINSGSQQTDQQELMRDWFGLLNHGYVVTPAGSSDSHDVSRYFVGQSRTYIRCNDENPGNIDVREVLVNFLEGNVMVSFGLLAEIEINDAYGPGEMAPATNGVKVSVRVSGPAWSRAERVVLYANGIRIREASIENQKNPGVKWSGSWTVTPGVQDLYLVAVAEGAGVSRPFWPIAKPYQPKSGDWNPSILGISGAVWIDSDGNGRRNSAKDYAEQLYAQAAGNTDAFIQTLANFDEAVAIQAAALLHSNGSNLSSQQFAKALRRSPPQVRSGFLLVSEELSQKD